MERGGWSAYSSAVPHERVDVLRRLRHAEVVSSLMVSSRVARAVARLDRVAVIRSIVVRAIVARAAVVRAAGARARAIPGG